MMADGKLAAVTGGSGFVGRRVVRELLERGHKVRVLARSAEKTRAAFKGSAGEHADRLTVVEGDLGKGSSLARLVEDADACVHLVGIIRETGDGQSFENVHVHGTERVIESCREAGVRRLLHMSALGVGPEGKAAYQQTKWRAELAVRRSGLDWTIFRPSLIHGPEGEFVRMMAEIAASEAPPWFFLPYFARPKRDESVPMGPTEWVAPVVAPIHVDDVARAFVEALEREDAVGEIFNLVGGEELPWDRMLETLRDELPGSNKKLAPWFVPWTHAAAIARIAKTVGLGSLLPFDEGQARMGAEDSVADPTKARRMLGIKPRGFTEALRSYAGQM